MIRYTISILLLVVVAIIAQQFIPSLTGLYGSRFLLLALVFLCASVTVPVPVMLLLAFVCGFLTDAQNTIGPHGGDPEVYTRPVEQLRFGYSILLYGFMGFLMHGIQPLFRQGQWQFSAMLSGVAVFLYLLVEYLLINFIRGGFAMNQSVLLKIACSAAITMVFSPLVFWLLFRLADWSGYTIRMDGLKKAKPRTLIA
jgi:cell shape-determining protein MreD